MRLAIVPVLAAALLAAGCDRQSSSEAQGNAASGNATAATDVTAISADEVQPSAAPATTAKADKIDRSHVGEAAPAHRFVDTTGRTVTLADFRGRPTLVNLWATWCVPCIRELPTIDALTAREAGKLNVVALSQDMNPEKVAPFVAARGFKALKVYTDPKMAWVPGVTATLPTTILYDSGGKEVLRVVGDLDWAGAQAAAAIGEAK